jgi:hypothetical protein
MKIVGVDLHAKQQSIAMLDNETGELMERVIRHEGNAVREFYAALEGQTGARNPRQRGIPLCPRRRKKQATIRGLNKDYNHVLKGLFTGAATRASVQPGPFQEFYQRSLAKGIKPTMVRLTLARKIAAITLTHGIARLVVSSAP